jgi:hypothetical protein
MDCAGKDFEHHEAPVIDEEPGSCGWWRCPACDMTGNLAHVIDRLAPFASKFYALQSQALGRDAVFLLPSDATPGVIGQFLGCDVIRAPGLPGPMVAIPAAL